MDQRKGFWYKSIILWSIKNTAKKKLSIQWYDTPMIWVMNKIDSFLFSKRVPGKYCDENTHPKAITKGEVLTKRSAQS